MPLEDVLLELVAEAVDGVDDDRDRELAVEAVRVAQGVREKADLGDVRGAALAALNAADDLDGPLGTAMAGGAAAAGLILQEPLELGAEVDDAGCVVEEDEAPAAE